MEIIIMADIDAVVLQTRLNEATNSIKCLVVGGDEPGQWVIITANTTIGHMVQMELDKMEIQQIEVIRHEKTVPDVDG